MLRLTGAMLLARVSVKHQTHSWKAEGLSVSSELAGMCVQAGRRWCLSGTPIQNSVDDLYSCFRFLRYNPYCKRAAFKAMLKEPLQDHPAKGAQLLQVCLKVSPTLLPRSRFVLLPHYPQKFAKLCCHHPPFGRLSRYRVTL